MAETVKIDESLLYPGDIIRFDYEIRTDNQVIRSLAVKNIKDAIWSDDRLDYQGSDVVTMGSVELARDVEILRIYAQVRRYRRGARQETQYAGVGAISIVAVVALVAGAGAVAVWGLALRDRGHVVQRIASDPSLSEQTKQAAFEAMGQGGIGSGISAFGGSLVTAVVIIGVLWALSLSRPGRGGEW